MQTSVNLLVLSDTEPYSAGKSFNSERSSVRMSLPCQLETKKLQQQEVLGGAYTTCGETISYQEPCAVQRQNKRQTDYFSSAAHTSTGKISTVSENK